MKKIAPDVEAKYEGYFINAEGDHERLPSDFYYRKLTDVQYRPFSSKEQIDVICNYDADPVTRAEIILCKGPELLLSMLTLWDLLADEIFSSQEKILFPEKYISEKSIKGIIDWCRFNGYPFDLSSASKAKANRPKKLFDLEPVQHLEFRLFDFISRLNEVYSAFCLYKMILDPGDEVSETVYIAESFSKDGSPQFTTIRRLSHESEKDTCKKIMEEKYSAIGLTSKISLDRGPHIDVTVNSLFDAALYELMILLNSPYKNRDVKICPICGKYFVPARRNQKYCHTPNPNPPPNWTCYPQKKYRREELAKIKAGSAKKATE